MFLDAARVLAQMVSPADLDQGAVYPELSRIRDCSHAVACAVIRRAVAEGHASPGILAGLDESVRRAMWFPKSTCSLSTRLAVRSLIALEGFGGRGAGRAEIGLALLKTLCVAHGITIARAHALLMLGLIGLALFELAKIYFIMPMPGSQRIKSLDAAYALHTWRWAFRLAALVAIVAGIRAAFTVRGWWRAVPVIVLLGAAGVGITANYVLMADRMFKQPEHLVLAPRGATESTKKRRGWRRA